MNHAKDLDFLQVILAGLPLQHGRTLPAEGLRESSLLYEWIDEQEDIQSTQGTFSAKSVKFAIGQTFFSCYWAPLDSQRGHPLRCYTKIRVATSPWRDILHCRRFHVSLSSKKVQSLWRLFQWWRSIPRRKRIVLLMIALIVVGLFYHHGFSSGVVLEETGFKPLAPADSFVSYSIHTW